MDKITLTYTNPPETYSKELNVPFYFKNSNGDIFKIKENESVIITNQSITRTPFTGSIQQYINSIDTNYNIVRNLVTQAEYSDKLTRLYYYFKTL